MTFFVWKENIPTWIKDSKSSTVIIYTSGVLINLVPKNKLMQIEETFDIKIDKQINLVPEYNNKIKKLSEPILKDEGKKTQGYTKNDNESLDQLFNIENNE